VGVDLGAAGGEYGQNSTKVFRPILLGITAST